MFSRKVRGARESQHGYEEKEQMETQSKLSIEPGTLDVPGTPGVKWEYSLDKMSHTFPSSFTPVGKGRRKLKNLQKIHMDTKQWFRIKSGIPDLEQIPGPLHVNVNAAWIKGCVRLGFSRFPLRKVEGKQRKKLIQ